VRSLIGQTFELLQRRLKELPYETKEDARAVLDVQEDIIDRFGPLRARKFNAARIRCHGDYHLGQVLYTGRDFAIIDFEGEPARPLSERRLKRSPLRDIAGMVRSFDYAAHSAALLYSASTASQEEFLLLERWGRFWYTWVSAAFLASYLETIKGARLLPENPKDVSILLNAYLLEKAVYEIGYELNNRPDWLRVPLRGIVQLLEE
jgi:maltose alpha-D-glucosyltransferase/alpha-amylase